MAPFIKVGERVRYIGTSKYRYEDWPEDAWLERGVTGTVTEFHEQSPEVTIGGERFEAIPAYVVVTWDFGGKTAIDAETENIQWQRLQSSNPKTTKEKAIEPEEGGNPMPKTERERIRFHERIFGKGAIQPLERLRRGQTANELMPMPFEEGPPLPRLFALRWPWRK